MANDTQDQYAEAWVLDVRHSSGTVRVSSAPVTSGAALVTLGNAYKATIVNGAAITVERSMPDVFYGIDYARVTTAIEIDNSDDDFDVTQQWTGTAVVLKTYDWSSDEARTEFSGVISRWWRQHSRIYFQLSSRVEALLRTRLPKYTIKTADFPYATDVGAALAVVYGTDVPVRPSLVRHDTTIDSVSPGGYDMAAAWGETIDGYARCPQILKVWGDVDTSKPGLEEWTEWATGQGSPAYASTTTFTASGDVTKHYAVGAVLRYRNTGGGALKYTHVTASSYAVGTPGTTTVTVADPDLAAGLNDISVAADYIAERNRYSLSSRPLLSLRFISAVPSSGVLLTLRDCRGTAGAAISNPADVIDDIITDTVWGMNHSVDTSASSTANAAYTAAGLGSACDFALAWDGQQLPALDALRPILQLRGGRVYYDGENDRWQQFVDTAPAAAALTLGLGDGVYNNIIDAGPIEYVDYANLTSTLTLRYCQGGRSTNGKSFTPRDFYYSLTSNTIDSAGNPDEIVSPVIRQHAAAKIVLGYNAQSRKRRDKKQTVACNLEARDASLGQLVTLSRPLDGISAESWQIWGKRRKLGRVELDLYSYNADIYTYVGADLSTPADVDVDEQVATAGTGANLLTNPDFSTRLRSATVPSSALDGTSIPGWAIVDTGGHLSGFSITADTACVGGFRLQLTVTGTRAALAANLPRLTGLTNVSGALSAIAVVPTFAYMSSVYSDSATGWRFDHKYVDSSANVRSTQRWKMNRIAETNGKGWSRYFMSGIAPIYAGTPANNAAYMYPEIVFIEPGTYQFDAVQLEQASRWAARPTLWKHHTKGGVEPGLLNAGRLTILASTDDPEAGTQILQRRSTVATLTGSSVTLVSADDGGALIPAGYYVESVLWTTLSGITYGGGGASFMIGTTNDPDWWGVGLTLHTAGNRSDADDHTAGGRHMASATNVIVKPNAGTFATGTGRAVAYLRRFIAPTV